ncbi:MAG: single-stranded-DNA-specific exonuclease RecJ [Pseudomonadota bacterium]
MASSAAALSIDHTPFLGVAKSLSGQRWSLTPAADDIAASLSQTYGLSDMTGRLLSARGVGLLEADAFLRGTLRSEMPDPSSLADMDQASCRIAKAIKAGEPITVFGDYDVDGATSAGCLLRFINGVGGRADAYIPDRMTEGYGPSAGAMTSIAGRGTKLVITVDCGIAAHEALKAAQGEGLEVIVLDHHKADAQLPPCVAAVNPNRLDDSSGLGMLAAVGVVFLTLVAVQRQLRETGYFTQERPEFPLINLLDMVALGTVCDVVPLTGLNRLFVRQGLKVLSQRQNMGLRALADVARLDERPDSGHLGFVFGPRINAGGRVGESSLGTRLLTSDDPEVTASIAAQLDAFNQERRVLEAEVTDQALALIGDPGDAPLIVVSGAGWHPGVIGLVASRGKDKFQRPAIVIGHENGIGKGSGRSITGVDLGNAVIDARAAGLLEAGGGHAMAAGLTVQESNIEALERHLTSLLQSQIQTARLARALSIDCLLSVGGATPELIDDMNQIGPFGVGNPAPKIAFANVTIEKADVVGTDHVRLFVKDTSSARLKVIAFRTAQTEMGARLLGGVGQRFHLAGRLKRDDWSSTPKAELHLLDAAPAQ